MVDYAHIGTITSVSPLTTCTYEGESGAAYKCIVADLDKKELPSYVAGAKYEGVAIIADATQKQGMFFFMANPTSSALGDFAAKEAWLIPMDSAFAFNEYGVNQALSRLELTVPQIENEITFMSITGSVPADARTITPSGWTGPCLSATLRDHKFDVHATLLKMSQQIKSAINFDASRLMENDYSILSGGILSPTGMQTIYTAGTMRYKGISSDFGVNTASLEKKKLYRINISSGGIPSAQPAKELIGSVVSYLDGRYLPDDAINLGSQAWARINNQGIASADLPNEVFTLATTASAQSEIYEKAGVSGPPAVVSGLMLRFFRTAGDDPFFIEIDNGNGNNKERLNIYNGFVALASVNKTFTCDTSKPCELLLLIQNDKSYLYVNRSPIMVLNSYATMTGVSNGFRFGFQNTTGANNVTISEIKTLNNSALNQGWDIPTGAVLGTALTTTVNSTQPVGLLGRDIDMFLQHRIEGALQSESQIQRLIPDFVFFPKNYYDGFKLNYVSYNSISIGRGVRRNNTDTRNIINEDTSILSLTTTGINGLTQSANLAGNISIPVVSNQVTGSGTAFLSDFVVGDAIYFEQVLVGNISVVASSTSVTGSGTTFANTFKKGYYIITNGGQKRLVTNVNSNTLLTVAEGWSSSEATVSYKKSVAEIVTAISSNTLLSITNVNCNNIVTNLSYKRGGHAPQAHYYIYNIYDNQIDKLIMSSRNLSGGQEIKDLPTGYSVAGQVRGAFCTYNDTVKNSYPINYVIPFTHHGNTICYSESVLIVLDAGTQTTYTAVDMSKYIPKISTRSKLYADGGYYTGTAPRRLYLRVTGSGLTTGTMAVLTHSAYDEASAHLEQETSADQSIDYYSLTYAVPWDINVTGYILDDII